MDYRLPLFGVAAVFALGTLFMPEKFMTVSGSAYAIDGDTLAFKDDRVRIVGIDAPDAPEGPKKVSRTVLQGTGQRQRADYLHQAPSSRLVAAPHAATAGTISIAVSPTATA